jgi:hypothetical protein
LVAKLSRKVCHRYQIIKQNNDAIRAKVLPVHLELLSDSTNDEIPPLPPKPNKINGVATVSRGKFATPCSDPVLRSSAWNWNLEVPPVYMFPGEVPPGVTIMDSAQHCLDQRAECIRLMKSAKSKNETEALRNISYSWLRLAGQIDRYNAMVREHRRK